MRSHEAAQDSDLYTVEHLYALVSDGQKADLIDGVLYMSSPDTDTNDELTNFLKDQFRPQLPLRDALQLGCNALQRAAEGQPRVGPDNLEACVLERTRPGRKFRRLSADVLRELLGS